MGISHASKELLSRVDALTRELTGAARCIRRELAAQDLVAASEAAEKLIESVSDLAAMKDEINAIAESRREQLENKFRELGADLYSECARKNWKVDGSWPSLYVQRAVHVEITEADRTVRVSGTKLKRASVESIIDALEPIIGGLIPKNFEPQAFIEQLAGAYDELRSDSAQVAVFDIYRALVIRMQPARFWRDPRSDRFNGLTPDQLRARLSSSLEAGCIATKDGRRLALYPPLDPKDGLFLYQPSERRFAFVGRIEFRLA